jgi:hypothetical protein
MGGEASDGDLRIIGSDGRTTILLLGRSGDILLGAADEGRFSIKEALSELAGEVALLRARVRALESEL